MQLLSTRAASFLALAAIALGACGDQATPTQLKPADANHLALPNVGDTLIRANCGIVPQAIGGEAHAASCGGGAPPPPPPPPPPGPTMNWIDHVPTQLDLDGTAASLQLMVSNSQPAVTDVWVSTEVVSNAGTLSTSATPVSCPGQPQGTLWGNCVMWLSPVGLPPIQTPPDFPAGPAKLHVYMTHGYPIQGGAILGGAKGEWWPNITLVDSRPKVTAVSLENTTLLLGSTRSFLGGLTSPGGFQSPMVVSSLLVQTYIAQGPTHRYTTSGDLNCPGSSPGVLPVPGCQISQTFSPSNTAPGWGTLVSGPATFVVQLSRADGRILSEKGTGVTIVVPPTISSVTTPDALLRPRR